jgi:hypothetical protein
MKFPEGGGFFFARRCLVGWRIFPVRAGGSNPKRKAAKKKCRALRKF